MSYETLQFQCKDGVAHVTLDRPDVMNAMDLQLMQELARVAISCDEDPSVRAVLLTGAGRAFSAGGDLASFAQQGDGLPGFLKKATTELHGAISRLARMDAPLITAVNGAAAGAGLSLALAGDLVVAAESARFTLAYTAAGLTPDGGSTFLLPRLIGLRRAQELVLTNRRLSAAEALDWGLVTQVVPDDQLLRTAGELAARMAAGPTLAFGSAKRLLLRSTGDALEAQMEHEARGIADAARSDDGREGIAAFLAKRAPAFRGA
jgi:2-(1,2-epoxy-1,2-dihydrophenyl)acetyl-CoA isomerase